MKCTKPNVATSINKRVFIGVEAIGECAGNGERPMLISKLQWMRYHGAHILVTSVTH